MLTAHELLGFMSPSLALEIISYVQESDKPVYRATLAAVAEARRVRPLFLERQPRTERNKTMLATLTRPALEPASGNLIRLWLVKGQKAMLGDFLDTLEIPHSEGVVENLPDKVEDAKLKSAVDLILSRYPAETVAVYLQAFNDMNEANWPNLKALLEAEPRLQLGGSN